MANELRLILGDQLNAAHSWFKEKSSNVTYVIAELHQEANYTTHHIQKISAFFAAMQAFASALEEAGHRVIYLTLDDTQNHTDLPALISSLITEHGIKTFSYQLPDEYRLREQLADYCKQLTIDSKAYDTEHFYLADNQLASYFKPGKKHRLEHFYRKMRAEFNVLMDDDGPLTGQWNFDSQNRNKLKASDLAEIPEPLVFANDVSDILKRIERHGIKTIGKAEKQTGTSINIFLIQFLILIVLRMIDN